MLMAIVGIMPLGSLVVGAISQRIGAPATVLGQGVIALVIALAFARALAKKSTEIDRPSFGVNEAGEVIAENIA